MAEETAAVLDFTDEDPFYWKDMNDKLINKGVESMAKEILAANDQLLKMVPDNAWSKTQTYMQSLAFMVLGNDGFIHQLYTRNKDLFPKSGKPDWYAGMSAEDKILYTQHEKHFAHLPMMDAACQEAAGLVMSLNLLQGFTLLTLKENLTDADMFTSDDYKQIVEDALEVGRIITTPWDVMEKKASGAESFYQKNLGKYSRSDLISRYREERIRDYRTLVGEYDVAKRMRMDSRGNFSVSPYTHTLMEILDTYTKKVSELNKENIEDRTDKVLEKVISFEVKQLSHLEKEMNDLTFYPVVSALKVLTKTVKEFTQSVMYTYDGFKDASDASPYCFMQKLPVSSVKKAYSYSPRQWNALESGTQFRNLYQEMANALTAHCNDFVYNHGHSELK